MTAANEPGALARLLGPIAKRGITACRVLAESVGDDLRVLVELAGLKDEEVGQIVRETSGVWLVRSVTSERIESQVRVVGASTASPCPWCGF